MSKAQAVQQEIDALVAKLATLANMDPEWQPTMALLIRMRRKLSLMGGNHA